VYYNQQWHYSHAQLHDWFVKSQIPRVESEQRPAAAGFLLWVKDGYGSDSASGT